MNNCKECGLPMDVCSALSQYREAVKYFKLGRVDEAGRYAESAEELYDNYRSAQKVG